ncbi:MAG TPA: hypothetical protein VFB58_02420 [Chloroflexota bacterium]|nr:hypothetical protein [Chloroflexota bacterium]
MAGLSEEEFEKIKPEILTAWERAGTRDAGLDVIVTFGRKYGYKNVIAALQGRQPKRFTREKTLDEWVDERHREEVSGG